MTEQPIVIEGIRPGLDVRGLDRGEIPQADWICACGHHERARGDDVAALTAKAIVGVCLHQTASKEAA